MSLATKWTMHPVYTAFSYDFTSLAILKSCRQWNSDFVIMHFFL